MTAPDDEQTLHPQRIAHPTAKRPRASRSDVDSLLEACWAQGCWVVKGGGGHFKVFPPEPGRRMVPIPATPSDWRALRNKRAQLRRVGLDPDFKK